MTLRNLFPGKSSAPVVNVAIRRTLHWGSIRRRGRLLVDAVFCRHLIYENDWWAKMTVVSTSACFVNSLLQQVALWNSNLATQRLRDFFRSCGHVQISVTFFCDILWIMTSLLSPLWRRSFSGWLRLDAFLNVKAVELCNGMFCNFKMQ